MFKYRKSLLLAALSVFVAEAVWGLADPTKPPTLAGQSKRQEPFKLNSLLVSGDRRVAIVNGQSVSVGEMVNGARVTYIDNKKLKLNKNGEVIELKPNRLSIRREK